MLARLMTQSAPIPLDRARLGAIACPTTVAWGGETRTCYRIVSEAFAAAVPDATAVTVEGAGHLLPEADPDAFARAVEAHLRRAS